MTKYHTLTRRELIAECKRQNKNGYSAFTNKNALIHFLNNQTQEKILLNQYYAEAEKNMATTSIA
jgi:hypothetical protein